jgi:hypothetical protein
MFGLLGWQHILYFEEHVSGFIFLGSAGKPVQTHLNWKRSHLRFLYLQPVSTTQESYLDPLLADSQDSKPVQSIQ